MAIEIRKPMIEDARHALAFINSLVTEGAWIAADTPFTLQEEHDHIATRLEESRDGKCVILYAMQDSEVVASGELHRNYGERRQHVAELRIGVKKGYRKLGVGGQLLQELFKQGQKLGIEIVRLTAFPQNQDALQFYEKHGFVKEYALKKEFKLATGEYADAVVMSRYLNEPKKV